MTMSRRTILAATLASLTAAPALAADPAAWRTRSLAAMHYRQDAPLYADDVCRAARELVGWTA